MPTHKIYELRNYRLHPGRRDELIDLFEREFIESQEATGMRVVATFRSPDLPDRFIWLRSFPDMEARKAALEAFYYGPVWRAYRDAANATMIDSDDVLLLRPVGARLRLPSSRPPIGAQGVSGNLFIAAIYTPSPDQVEAFHSVFDSEIAPKARAAGAEIVARFSTEHRENNFPPLPVREDAAVYVALARFSTAATIDDVVASLAPEAGDFAASATPQFLILHPTARSLLR